MLPILLKLTFESFAEKMVYLVLALGLMGYAAFFGARNAARREERVWRAILFACGTGLALSVASVWAMPPMTEGLASAIRWLVWGFSAAVTAAAFLYGYKAPPEGKSPVAQAVNNVILGVIVSAAAIHFGLSGQMGRGTGLPIHTYGLMIAFAFLIAIWVGSRMALRSFPEYKIVDGKEIPAGPYMADITMDIGFWMLISGIVGAKLLFIIVNWDRYSQNPLDALSLSGGLVFYGGFLGSAAALCAYCKIRNLNFLRLTDAFAPALAVGHMIGRMGCLAAGCCWGGFAKEGSKIAIRFPSAAHLPFGGFGTSSLAYSDQIKDNRWVDALGHVHDHAVAGAHQISAYAAANGYTLPVYPTQLMEIVGELIVFCILMFFINKKRFHGQIFATWLIGYAVIRMINEFFRGDVARGYIFRFPAEDPMFLSTSQGIALGLFLAGISIMAVQYHRTKKMRMAAV